MISGLVGGLSSIPLDKIFDFTTVNVQITVIFLSLDINDSVGNLCQHGSKCVDMVNDFKCKCAKGWEGARCEISK